MEQGQKTLQGYAKKLACDCLLYPTDPHYEESTRQWQGCPSIAITRGGRLFAAWYSGGNREPHMKNYNVMVYSDDQGCTWSKPVLVIPSNEELCVHALDLELFTAPDGRLFLFWVQENTERQTPESEMGFIPFVNDGFVFFLDREHAVWTMVCENPDAEVLSFSAPRYIGPGFLRCKPCVLDNGDWLCFPYDHLTDTYAYTISEDQGQTFTRYYGPKKLPTPFDEAMAYQRRDGSVRMLARTSLGKVAQSFSFDRGRTWTEAECADITHSNTRLYVSRTPSGRVMLVYNDHATERTNLTVALSEDDGATWPYRRVIDARHNVSYPEVDFFNGKAYLIYDRDRCEVQEILLAVFTEEDIIAPSGPIEPRIISKGAR